MAYAITYFRNVFGQDHSPGQTLLQNSHEQITTGAKVESPFRPNQWREAKEMAFQEWGPTIGAIMAHRLSPANPLQMVSDLWSGLNLKAPKKSLLSASELPPAFRRLLVHESGMTTTLEKRWGEPMTIKLLSDDLSTRCKSLFRLVALHPQSNPEPVEIAIIRIPLTTFTPKLRILFLEAQRPFGTLLSEAGISFQARPQAYFSCLADRELSQRTGLKEGTCLYGRLNHLLNDEGALLCETAEALPKA